MNGDAAVLELPPGIEDEELDQEDRARVLAAFRGQPGRGTPTLRFVHRSPDGAAPAYVFDEDSLLVYILD